MNYIKKIGISLLYIFIPIICILFVLTLLNYFNIINYKILCILRFILFIISILLGGISIGRNSEEKGWLEGFKLSLIILIIYLVINYLIFGIKFEFKDIIYYLIIIGSSILGSVLGINKKKKN